MIRAILFSVCLVMVGSIAYAQKDLLTKVAPKNVPGQWKGKLIQGEGGLAREYKFELTLDLEDEQRIVGSSYIQVNDSYAKITLQGALEGNTLTLKEAKIENYKITPAYLWCIKTMDLKFLFKRSFFRLEGKWQGHTEQGKCTPGTIHLKKATIKA